MKMIFVFIDGLGIGTKSKSINPIYRCKAKTLKKLLKSKNMVPIDASLGIDGLPQSATGQTAIFTGVNASQILGRHLSGQPTITLRNIISKNNLFKHLVTMGYTVTNSNVYREKYIQELSIQGSRKQMPSVTTVMCLSAGTVLRTTKQYRQGKGIYHDITGHILNDLGYQTPIITPEEAAKRLYAISRNYSFTLFEHFITDIAGHSTNMDISIERILILDKFLESLLKLIDYENDVLVITSDHGNIENMSLKTHTYNKVPFIYLGNRADMLGTNVASLVDITPAIINFFSVGIHYKI
jgi:2,3-bisphosphoglycerate-independent phosphoglycerate mutase